MQTATEQGKSQTLHFYTLGPEFTELVRTFIREGSFHTAYEILKDGGAPQHMIEAFFQFEARFVGDTRDDSFGIELCESETDLRDVYRTAIRTLMSSLRAHDVSELMEDRNWLALMKVMSKEQAGLHYLDGLYKLNPELNKNMSGVILKGGTFVQCEYQGHTFLYRLLYQFGLANASEWTSDTYTIHITSGEISGALGYAIKEADSNIQPTQEQIETLIKYRKVLNMYGSRSDTVMAELYERTCNEEDFGGKYNNLRFLSKYYKKIRLPRFSKTEIVGLENQCIRTSPKYSMPGLLHSKFVINENSIKEIEEDFARTKHIMEKKSIFGNPIENELHYFYQEFLEGDNGVAHYRGETGFNYSVSKTRGDIVGGKKSNDRLSPKHAKELEKICTDLYEDLGFAIQIEFVIHKDKVYLVQLRQLQNEPSGSMGYIPDTNRVIGKGKSFSSGHVEDLKISEVLVVDEDSDNPEPLVGKKALIVKNHVEFSHVLALSKALGIPSIYGVGDIKLPKRFNINTTGRDGFILKPYE